jgi:hypothetical protein
MVEEKDEEKDMDKEYLKQMTSQMIDLIEKFGNLSTHFYDPDGRFIIGRIFEGDFTMTLIGGDVVHPKAIQLNGPPYKLGEFGHYFHFRLDRPFKKIVKWGDFEWYTSSPECFTEIRNGDKTLVLKRHKDSTEYIFNGIS